MRKVILLLCVLLAFGWLSDAGMLTLKVEGSQVKGIPVLPGHVLTAYHDGYVTTFAGQNPLLQKAIFGNVMFVVNGQGVVATRLGNGWLFQYKEQKGVAPSVAGAR